jgi:hypothetical protein
MYFIVVDSVENLLEFPQEDPFHDSLYHLHYNVKIIKLLYKISLLNSD